VLVLGDNVYEDGEPKYFKGRIVDPYQALFEKKVRFYPILGNHDVRLGYGDQQLAFWGAPQFYRQKIGNVEIFAIDTTVFLPNYDNAHVHNPFKARKEAETQLTWLDKALSESQAKYKVVMGHYPIYSSGLHGKSEGSTLKLRSILEPVFLKNRVDVYLSGHEHHYEKSSLMGGIQHFVSGAAGKLRPKVHYEDCPPYPREKLINKHHFMVFEEGAEGLSYEVISRRGQVLDSGKIQAKGPQGGISQVRFA
jgi:tartrate-resistant acid phosphatase type 5